MSFYYWLAALLDCTCLYIKICIYTRIAVMLVYMGFRRIPFAIHEHNQRITREFEKDWGL